MRNRQLATLASTLTLPCELRKMTRMSNHKYLDPAYTLIKTIGDGKLSRGIDAVAEIVGRDRANVYRWMRPKERGGTDGFIPAGAQAALSKWSKGGDAPKVVKDFFGLARAA